MKSLMPFKNSYSNFILWGIIAGILLSADLSLQTYVNTKILEIVMFLIYSLILITPALIVPFKPKENKYFKLFISSFSSTVMMLFCVFLFLFFSSENHSVQWNTFILIIIVTALTSIIITFLASRNIEKNFQESPLSIFDRLMIKGILIGVLGGALSFFNIYFLPKFISAPLCIILLIVCPITASLTLKFDAFSNNYVRIYIISLISYLIPNFYLYYGIYCEFPYKYNWYGFGMMSVIGIIACAFNTFLITRNRLADVKEDIAI
jgi:hypothetical protein